jgi:hypothetical protein
MNKDDYLNIGGSIIKGLLSSEGTKEWLNSGNIDIGSLKNQLEITLNKRFERLIYTNTGSGQRVNHKEIRKILLNQYNQHLLERRNLDTVGWSIFGGSFAMSFLVLGLVIKNFNQIIFPLNFVLLVLPLLIHLFGTIALKKIRIARHLQREIATAIEECLGLFHLSITKISNKSLRIKHDTLINLSVYIYILLILILIASFYVEKYV